MGGLGVNLPGLAGCRVQRRHRRVGPQGHVDGILHGDDSLAHVRRHGESSDGDGPARAERSAEGRRAPWRDVPFPEQHAAEGVAGREDPFVGHGGVHAGERLVADIEQPAPGRDHGAHAGGPAVTSSPERCGGPLEMFGRAHHGILRHGVVPGVVQVVGPLVDLRRPRLDCLRPSVGGSNAGGAAGGQDTHHLVAGYFPAVLHHEQIDEVIRIGQRLAVESIDGHRPVDPHRMDGFARPIDVVGIDVQPMHQVALTAAERRGQRSVAAPHVDHKTAPAGASFHELGGKRLGLGSMPCRRLAGAGVWCVDEWAASGECRQGESNKQRQQGAGFDLHGREGLLENDTCVNCPRRTVSTSRRPLSTQSP